MDESFKSLCGKNTAQVQGAKSLFTDFPHMPCNNVLFLGRQHGFSISSNIKTKCSYLYYKFCIMQVFLHFCISLKIEATISFFFLFLQHNFFHIMPSIHRVPTRSLVLSSSITNSEHSESFVTTILFGSYLSQTGEQFQFFCQVRELYYSRQVGRN